MISSTMGIDRNVTITIIVIINSTIINIISFFYYCGYYGNLELKMLRAFRFLVLNIFAALYSY